MAHYIDAEKLKVHIEAKMGILWDKLPDADKEHPTDIELRDLGMYMALEGLIDDLDSLQQEQPIDKNILTWRDINEIERIINKVHYEFPHGIGEESFGKLVLERFIDFKDDVQEQPKFNIPSAGSGAWGTTPPKFKLDVKPAVPEVNINKGIDDIWRSLNTGHDYVIVDSYQDFLGICMHCFELGLNARKEG